VLVDVALSDEEMVRRIGSRHDPEAEGELFRRMAPRIRLYGLRHLRDSHAADDLTQQVVITTLEALRSGRLREPEKLVSFVLGTCRMTVLDLRRGTERRARLLVAPWPLFVSLERGYPFTPAHEAIHRFCLGARIPHHDLLRVFQGQRTSDFWVHPVDHHPNEVAHRLAAESLLPDVLKLAGP